MLILASSMVCADHFENSMPLTDIRGIPAKEKEASAAAIKFVKKFGYNPDNFLVVYNCKAEVCEIDVFPKELETDKYKRSFGCPLKVCATINYSFVSKQIEKATHWR